MRTSRSVRVALSLVISTLSMLGAVPAGAAEDAPPEEAAPPPAPPPPVAEKPGAEQAGAEPLVEEAKPPPPEIVVASFRGWQVTLEGRMNSFLMVGSGKQLVQMDPKDGVQLGEGGGLGLNQNQTNSSGNFLTPRLRNGFLANVLTFKISRNLTSKTKMTAVLSLWSDIETNLTVYLFPQTYMQEGYMKLEGPWGSLAAGRQLALFSRGEVEIDFNYAHGFGGGWPCNFNSISPTCGQIGFGVLFPFFRSGVLYTTPSLGGLTVAGGLYDPVMLPGKWERVITPTLEGEIAYTSPLGRLGMFKLFVEGLWQRLGGQYRPPNDMRTTATTTVDQAGVAGGLRLELGPVRLGVSGHYGNGLGFYYAQENSQAAYYNAPTDTDPNDGKLRTFQGFYAQLMLVLGKIDLGAGVGASQAVRFSFETTSVPAGGDITGVVHPPKQNLGINGVLNVHIADNLVWDLDYFRAQYSWWGASFTQTVNIFNTGITMLF
jgi:hypothetical protein